MATVDLSKVMNLADAQEIYKDLRDRIKNAGTVKDVTVGGTSVVDENGVAAITLPTVSVTDVQINGTSILNSGVANIPLCDGGNTHGVVRVISSQGVGVTSGGILTINPADSSDVKGGAYTAKALVPNTQHRAVFFGLSKVAGVDLKDETVTLGTYPDSSKQAIQKMLGLDGLFGDYQNGNIASKAYAVGETFIMDGKRYKVTAAISDGGLITPGTNCELDPLDSHVIKHTDIGPGLIWHNNSMLIVNPASTSSIKSGASSNLPITPLYVPDAVFYGLSKLAGVDLANEAVTVGTYPATAKTAILTMLGAVGKTDIAGSTGENKGIAYFNGNYGVAVNSETGGVYVSKPSDDIVKAGANDYKPIVPSVQHKSVFYGLAKAAGDTTQAQSDNAVGTYTDAAKTAIQSMLGVSTGAILIENVSGGTPTLTCLPNVRYKCGEVSTLSITPPASGSCEVIFESGSTATLLTVPNTVKFPPWFDATALETGTIYDIIITDGVYGAVMSWAS